MSCRRLQTEYLFGAPFPTDFDKMSTSVSSPNSEVVSDEEADIHSMSNRGKRCDLESRPSSSKSRIGSSVALLFLLTFFIGRL